MVLRQPKGPLSRDTCSMAAGAGGEVNTHLSTSLTTQASTNPAKKKGEKTPAVYVRCVGGFVHTPLNVLIEHIRLRTDGVL